MQKENRVSVLVVITILIAIIAALIGSMNAEAMSSMPVDDTQDINSNSIGQEMRMTEQNQSRLLKNQPPPQLQFSLERQNIIERIKLWNDRNKLSYIYLMSYGRVVDFYVVKGKVSSVNSRLTTGGQIVKDPNFDGGHGAGGIGSLLVESPQEDGSYGTNGDAIFFFAADGTYVEWNGDYLLLDKPRKVNMQPLLTRKVD